MVDALRFPTLAAYLGRLPEGIDSYPECQTKGSMIRSALEGHDLSEERAHLPRAVGGLADDPPPPTRWVPLVHGDALFHAVCDRFYPSEDEVLEWTYRRTMSMGQSPMYRRLASVAGPGFFLKMAGRVHRVFERGTESLVEVEQGSARIEMRHPPHLHSPLNHVSNVAMLRAIIEITGGTDPVCEMRHSRPEGAVFECTWR